MSILLHFCFVGGNALTGLSSVRLPVVMADDALFIEEVGWKTLRCSDRIQKRPSRLLADRF